MKIPKIHIKRTDVERMLILCSAALVVALALRGQQEASVRYEEPVSEITVASDTTDQANLASVTVYYQDGEGYLVPVTMQASRKDGIAKAALSLLVQTSANDLTAARMGLKTTIPEGTKIDLDIADKKARVDLIGAAAKCRDAEAESIMVSSVMHTLCAFDTVDEVSFLFDGQQRSRLTFGTAVSGAFAGGTVNAESVEILASAGETINTVQLYFPSSTGRMLVPVTRTVYSDADVTTAIVELAKGPRSDSGLTAPLPKNCAVKGVTMKNGVVTIDFSKEFLDAMDSSSSLQTLRSVLFTAAQFPGVKQVKLKVEGKDYTPPDEAKPSFINQQSDIITYYPGVIEID